jgi:hypothetical protein
MAEGLVSKTDFTSHPAAMQMDYNSVINDLSKTLNLSLGD